MVNVQRPWTACPPLLEEFVEDPDLEGFDWDAISVLYEHKEAEPSALEPPCEKYNKDACLCQATCPCPHVCNSCFQPDHPATTCPKRHDHIPSKEATGALWDDTISYSPCAQASLSAAPLPRPPRLSELPPQLVRLVDDYPELFKIVTPIDVPTLEGLLARHPNQAFVKSVIIGLREGFWPFANAPTVLPNESRSQNRLRNGPKKAFLDSHLQEELESGRFSRPLERFLPGMACMPVRVKREAGKDKFRLICDHSAGEHSLNSLIPQSERGGQVDRIGSLIHALRSRGLDLADITLFKSDVSHAYRILPMSPYWQALQAVRIDGKYYIDRCNSFGNAGSSRLFCEFYSLILWIAENVWRLTDMFSYVDDNFSWEYATRIQYYAKYDRYLPRKQARLLEMWDCLGIPHASRKQEFDRSLTIIGFRVDLPHMRVTASEGYLEMVERRLNELSASPTMAVPLHRCQSLAGRLNWIFEVHPLLRPGVVILYKKMAEASLDGKDAEVRLSKHLISDLRWVAKWLKRSQGMLLIRMGPQDPHDVPCSVYIHASVGGFGIWFPSSKYAFYHKFPVPEQDSFVSLIHAFAVICAIHISTQRYYIGWTGRSRRLTIFTRDKFTVDTFDKFRTPDQLRRVLRLGMELMMKADMDYAVSQAGNEADFYVAARLTRDAKETLDNDYPNISFRRFNIPEKLARRARWEVIEGQSLPTVDESLQMMMHSDDSTTTLGPTRNATDSSSPRSFTRKVRDLMSLVTAFGR